MEFLPCFALKGRSLKRDIIRSFALLQYIRFFSFIWLLYWCFLRSTVRFFFVWVSALHFWYVASALRLFLNVALCFCVLVRLLLPPHSFRVAFHADIMFLPHVFNSGCWFFSCWFFLCWFFLCWFSLCWFFILLIFSIWFYLLIFSHR